MKKKRFHWLAVLILISGAGCAWLKPPENSANTGDSSFRNPKLESRDDVPFPSDAERARNKQIREKSSRP